MNNSKYFPPVFGKPDFHCPHCDVYAHQCYSGLVASGGRNMPDKLYINKVSTFSRDIESDWIFTKCQKCNNIGIWYNEKMIFPKKMQVALPNLDLDDDIKADYMEAALILTDSPRAAAALLRLALQKLCKQLGEKGEHINEDIKKMVSKGLNPHVQMALDALRITGNNAVHPGEINLKEQPEMVIKLFDLINFIANKMITEPNEIKELYGQLPNKLIKAIDQRDKKP